MQPTMFTIHNIEQLLYVLKRHGIPTNLEYTGYSPKYLKKYVKQMYWLNITKNTISNYKKELENEEYMIWNKPDSKIYFSIPDSIDTNTKIIFIMHGASRSAKKYLNDWLPLVKNRPKLFSNFLMLFFSKLDIILKFRLLFNVSGISKFVDFLK